MIDMYYARVWLTWFSCKFFKYGHFIQIKGFPISSKFGWEPSKSDLGIKHISPWRIWLLSFCWFYIKMLVEMKYCYVDFWHNSNSYSLMVTKLMNNIIAAGHQWLLGLTLDKDVADTDQYLYTRLQQKWHRLERTGQNT